jgi:hypothetical protein
VNVHKAVVRFHPKVNGVAVVLHVEPSRLVLSGEQTTAGKPIEEGVGVPSRDVDALARFTVLVPYDSHAMSRVLARQTEPLRKPFWPYGLQANEADSGYRLICLELRPERWGEQLLDDIGIDSEIDEQATPDHAFDFLQQRHDEPLVLGWPSS